MSSLPGTTPVEPRAALSVRDLSLAAVVALAAVFAHREALRAMVHVWDVSPMYSYGYTVPLISAYLLWRQRARLAAVSPKPSWVLGTGLVGVSVLMALAARVGGIQVLDQLAFLTSLMAAIVLLLGRSVALIAWAPLAYLLLMIPLWDGLTERLHEPFQLRSAAIGVWILQAIGVPAFREGTMITLPGVTLEVARACSGVNYLVAVVALGLPLAYLYLPGIWRRLALLLSTLVVAALSNGLRVALIGLLAHLEIGSPLHGPFHVLHGLFVAGVGYAVLFLGLRLLTPREPQGPTDETQTEFNKRPLIPRVSQVSVGAACGLAAVFVLVGLSPVERTVTPVKLNGALDEFPRVLGAWQSTATNQIGTPEVWPGADAELRRRYRRKDGALVDLYIGYFEQQRQGREIVGHQTTELHNRAVRVEFPSTPDAIFAVNRAAADRDPGVVLFWYELDAGPEVNRYAVKLKTLWNTALRGRGHGAVVALSTVAGLPAADRELAELASLVRIEIASRMPGRVQATYQ